MDYGKYLTAPELAERLGCSVSFIEKNITRPTHLQLPYIRVGRLIRYDFDAVVKRLHQLSMEARR